MIYFSLAVITDHHMLLFVTGGEIFACISHSKMCMADMILCYGVLNRSGI